MIDDFVECRYCIRIIHESRDYLSVIPIINTVQHLDIMFFL